MRVDLLGSSTFILPTAQRLFDEGMKIRCITTIPPSSHRSRAREPQPLKEFALKHHLPIEYLRTSKALKTCYEHTTDRPDAAIVAAFGLLIPSSLLAIPRLGFLNIHPSLLPLLRGPSPIQSALFYGDRATGVTIILMDDEMDHGPILAQQTTTIVAEDDFSTLHERLAHIGARLMIKTLALYNQGALAPTPQQHDQATYTKKITRNDGRIDWNAPAGTIVRQSRAYNPWPGVWTATKHNQKELRLKLFAPIPLEPSPHPEADPGSVIAANQDGIIVQCGESSAVLWKALQREGGQRISPYQFLLGAPWIRSARFR